MKHYDKLVDMGIFSFFDIEKMVGNKNTARSLVNAYIKKGYIQSVRRNLYVAISFETKQPVVNKFVIASHATDSSCISHHTAFEYYGMANQVFYEIYTSSKTEFRSFEFDGLFYKCIQSKMDDGIDKTNDGVCVTDMERTVVDSIKDFEKIAGLEELLRCLEMITYLDTNKLKKYLEAYNSQILYQKIGYILGHFKAAMKLEDGLFEFCKDKLNKSVRYFYNGIEKESPIYNNYWQLFVPASLLSIIDDGGNEIV
ncbi:MAG: type IV toxin-antitoxin system AbiEi family antitoxin domain-containing protein [Candidatus Humimicrobiaceae bacterium]